MIPGTFVSRNIARNYRNIKRIYAIGKYAYNYKMPKRSYMHRAFRYMGIKGRKKTFIRRHQRGFMRKAGYYGRYAKGNPMQESKFKDTLVAINVVATTGERNNISLVAQGDGEGERIGRRFTISSITVRGSVGIPSGTNQLTSDIVKVMVIQDKQCNGVLHTVADVLGATPTIFSYFNLENKSRFKILASRYYHVNKPMSGDGTTTKSGTYHKYFSIHMKVHIPIEMSAATATITNVRSNNISVLYISQIGIADIDFRTRIRFKG